jgi:hypothetical protein
MFTGPMISVSHERGDKNIKKYISQGCVEPVKSKNSGKAVMAHSTAAAASNITLLQLHGL